MASAVPIAFVPALPSVQRMPSANEMSSAISFTRGWPSSHSTCPSSSETTSTCWASAATIPPSTWRSSGMTAASGWVARSSGTSSVAKSKGGRWCSGSTPAASARCHDVWISSRKQTGGASSASTAAWARRSSRA